MYDQKDKRRLYWLMEEYLGGKMDEFAFSNEYFSTYDLKLNDESLDPIEKEAFFELGEVVARYSPYEKDQEMNPDIYFPAEHLRAKIIQTWNRLKSNSSTNLTGI